MPRSLIAFALVLAVTPAVVAEPVSFRRAVIPILTKAGCNSGGCHGTPTGKNGFRLSLRGYDPALDLHSLTREFTGRRIDPIAPGESLLLRKATGREPHEGGRRIEPESASFALIRDWIAQGASDDAAVRPKALAVSPLNAIVEPAIRSAPLKVVATFPDGSTSDVTHLVRFSVNDDTVATVSADGLVQKKTRGEVAVAAEYMGEMAIARVLFRDAAADYRSTAPAEFNYVDKHVFARLRDLQIEPSALCRDEEFIRRAHLDVIGRLPTPGRVRQFLLDSAPDKRAKLIDELLDRDEFADFWGAKWADRLGVNQRFVGKIGAVKYHQWVREQVAANVPEDEFARRVLTAAGGNYTNPAAGFFRRMRSPEARAEEVSQLFLGVRIGCAKCHNHPGERWTQDDYYHLAAFFARLKYRDGPFFIQVYDKEETVVPLREGDVTHPRTGQTMPPKYLGGTLANLGPEDDRRTAFANWLTAPENPFFARAAANRIWFHLMGRGIVDPVDDFRGTNPPANEELLGALAADLIHAKFDRKHLIRRILNSRTYQLSSTVTPTNSDDAKYFSHSAVRRLSAEQLLDAIADATGVPEKFPGQPEGLSAARLPDGEYKHPFLEAFGRPARAMTCECERDGDTNLGQALHLVGGRVLEEKLRHPEGRIAKLLQTSATPSELIDELFLATLSRFPTTAERSKLTARLTTADKRAALENILHALVNHPEYMFQH